jgi:hypothetical protein
MMVGVGWFRQYGGKIEVPSGRSVELRGSIVYVKEWRLIN